MALKLNNNINKDGITIVANKVVDKFCKQEIIKNNNKNFLKIPSFFSDFTLI